MRGGTFEWKAGAEPHDARLFVDLPGRGRHDTLALGSFGSAPGRFSNPHLHLVLNAAYEAPFLLTQTRALARLPISDLILTHLDEEPRWGKLWNLVLGTNFTSAT